MSIFARKIHVCGLRVLGMPIDQRHFYSGRRDSNPGPFGLAEILTVCPAKTVKKVAERSEALVRTELKIAITLSKMNIFSI